MKSRISFNIMVAFAAMALCGRMVAQTNAANAATGGSSDPATATSEIPPVQLSNGVSDILKLVRAKVSDDVIMAFIKGSGRIYRLSVSEVLHLREQGVSDPALTAMLESQKNAAPVSLVAAQPAPAVPASVNPQPASTYTAPTPVYVESPPVYVYPSSAYYDNSWPYYGGYWGYPGVSLSFGFGSGYYGGYYGGYYRPPYGGYYGGYHGGGHPPTGGKPPAGQPPGGKPPGRQPPGGQPSGGRPSGGGGAHK